MITYEGIDRNFGFLVLEVRRQLESTHQLMDQPGDALTRSILSRDNYIDTLKSLIEKKCISYFRHTPTIDRHSANLVTAIGVATSNLERIADFCVNIVTHVGKLTNHDVLERFAWRAYFDELFIVIGMVTDSFASPDTSAALRICRSEQVLDDLFQRDTDLIRTALRTGEDTDDLLACLYVFHYLERISDSMLNIGEAVLLAATGEKLKLHEYLRLQEALGMAVPGTDIDDYKIDVAWETRSGCRIAKIEEKDEEGDLEAIFKKGHASKLRRERANIAMWDDVMPGLPPKVLEFREDEEDATLLLEFLDGYTLRDMLVNGEPETISMAMGHLERALRTCWLATRENKPVQAKFIEQARGRLDEVLRLHPSFDGAALRVGSLVVQSLRELLDEAREIEESMAAPFTVLIHGDLNTDNIIYAHRNQRIHFIDLHRSRPFDYVQDVSVFLVSNFRMPVFESSVRETLDEVTQRFYLFAKEFAARNEDDTFSARLALGLARSFVTSTRFEVDPQFAQVMYQRCVYLLESIIRHRDKPWSTYVLREDLLSY